RSGAGISQGRKAGFDDEVVEGCENRVPVPFRGLFVVLRQGEEKLQDLFRGNTGEVTLRKPSSKSMEHVLTGLDRIFFSSWLCGTADGNRLPEKRSWCTSGGWG
ncbi:MAG: hypothetical protein RBS34_12295, partial [Desulfofustis sp.]|nr:hypothetical protein [Desulfofustis sp.]